MIDITGYKLTFDDEFSNLSVSQGGENTMWADIRPPFRLNSNADIGFGDSGFVDPASGINPFGIQNGALNIQAVQNSNPVIGLGHWASGLLETQNSFSQEYGYFEIRAQLPLDAGVWPAFWLLPENNGWPPEVDVFEAYGTSDLYQTVHTGVTGSDTTQTTWSNQPSMLAGFHTYGVLWTPDQITFYFDGKAVGQQSTPADLHQPMYMLIDLAMQAGAGVSTDPKSMQVDYVRAYSNDPNATAVPIGTVSSPDGLSTADLHGATGAPTQPPNLTHSRTVLGPHNFIDFLNFECSYSDLVKAFGTDQEAMEEWYNTREPIENRIETFDGLDYVASYGDLVKAFAGAGSPHAVQDAGATHYITSGLDEGRVTTFNGLDYIASYSDLAKALGADNDAGAYHFIEQGAAEGRTTTFDGLAYIASYGDLITALGANEQAGAAHFIDFGSNEGRTTTFDGLDYVASYGDLVKAFAGAGSPHAVQDAGATHYITSGLDEGRVTTFNGLDYIASYSDLAKALGANNDAGAYHFIEQGAAEGRTTTFDGLAYIANYSDLMDAFGANNDAGAVHFIDSGHSEGRVTTFDVAGYEAAHPDLIGRFATNDQFLTAYINTFTTTGQFLI